MLALQKFNCKLLNIVMDVSSYNTFYFEYIWLTCHVSEIIPT
jgi:hypothetical protein